MLIVEQVYALISELAKTEIFGLISQLRRSSTSIPLNISEGYGRQSSKSYLSFLRIARSSNLELETGLLICIRLGFFSNEQVKELLGLIDEESRMLNAMIEKISLLVNKDN